MNLLIIKNNLKLTFEQLGFLYYLLKSETKQDGTFSKSLRDLGDEFNCGYDKVQRFIQTLEKNNIISKTQQDKFSTPIYKWNISILSDEHPRQQQVQKQPQQSISSELQLAQKVIPCINQQMLDILKKPNNTLPETQKYFKLCFNIDLSQEQYNSIRNILDLPLNYNQENSEKQLI